MYPSYDSTTMVGGIEFGVRAYPGVTVVGCAWVEDTVSGTVFGVVEEGTGLEDLRKNLAENLAQIVGHCRDEIKVEPVLVGKGWGPTIKQVE